MHHLTSLSPILNVNYITSVLQQQEVLPFPTVYTLTQNTGCLDFPKDKKLALQTPQLVDRQQNFL